MKMTKEQAMAWAIALKRDKTVGNGVTDTSSVDGFTVHILKEGMDTIIKKERETLLNILKDNIEKGFIASQYVSIDEGYFNLLEQDELEKWMLENFLMGELMYDGIKITLKVYLERTLNEDGCLLKMAWKINR